MRTTTARWLGQVPYAEGVRLQEAARAALRVLLEARDPRLRDAVPPARCGARRPPNGAED